MPSCQPRKRTTGLTKVESSPYGSPSCTIPFARPLTIPLDVLKKSPKLHAAYEARLPELPAIPEDVGHVLVHFLHTGRLESLRPKPTDTLSKQIWELKTSIQAYAAARNYDLPDLMRLAEAKIDKHGEDLPLPALLEVARDAYPTLTDGDGWFLDYLRSRIRPHLKDPQSLLGSNLLDEISTILSPNRVLLRTVLELFCERIAVRQEPATSPIASPVTNPGSSDRVSPLPPASPMSLLDIRQRPVLREALPAVRKQTPWPSPDAMSEASWSKETSSERTLPETAPPRFEAQPVADLVRVPVPMPDLGPVIVEVLPEPETADKVRAVVEPQLEPAAASEIERNSEPETGAEVEPEMKAAVEPEFKAAVEPEAKDENIVGDSAPQREGKDSGKGIELETLPEERELATPAPVSELETELKSQLQVRPPVLREADSGFWETPEVESGKEPAPSVAELEPVVVPASASTTVHGAAHELESSVGALEVPAVEIRDFAHDKSEREDEVPVELVPVAPEPQEPAAETIADTLSKDPVEPKPEPEPTSSSLTEEPSEAPVADLKSEHVPEIVGVEAPPETAQSEELEKKVAAQPETEKVEPLPSGPEQESTLTV